MIEISRNSKIQVKVRRFGSASCKVPVNDLQKRALRVVSFRVSQPIRDLFIGFQEHLNVLKVAA